MKAIEVKDVCYGRILKKVSFDWRQGEIIALMGDNGSGKSTLARLLAGLIKPEDGEIRLSIDGCSCSWDRVKRWQEIGLVGQHPRRQTIGASVAEELSFGLLNLGQSKKSIQGKVREIVSSIGLEGKEVQSPAILSGGERQRLVTAAILAMQPSFLILDEGLTMLDSHAQEKILKLLFQVRETTGQLWITHDPDLAKNADRLLIIENGKLVDRGNPRDALTGVEFSPDFSSSKQRKVSAPGKVILEWRQARIDSRLHLNAVVHTGEFIGIIGPSGSGKTTLLESAMGLITLTDGELLLGGERATKSSLNPYRQKAQYVLQEAGEYLIGRSVYHEIYYGESRQTLKEKRQEKLRELYYYDIHPDMADKTPECLSGGERQKVALVSALRSHPHVLLLDEPLLGLDAANRKQIQNLISGLQGITILYVTHDLREIIEYADRLWLVKNGQVAVDCSVKCWQEYRKQFKAAGVRC